MYSLLKPFIFKIDPEMAHDFAIKSLKYNFLPEDLFKVEHGNKPLPKNTNALFDFETSELAETKFTIKAIDHENNNIYMFNKKTYVLTLSWSKVYYRASRDNNWSVDSELVYGCTVDARPND